MQQAAAKRQSELVKIGVIAKSTGLSVQALRYYQQRGLISPKQQLSSGYRLYAQDIVERIQFIQRCKNIGFSLEEISQLLALRDDPKVKAAEIKQKVEAKLAVVEQKIIELSGLKTSLQQLSASCSGEGLIGECPIISKLWSEAT